MIQDAYYCWLLFVAGTGYESAPEAVAIFSAFDCPAGSGIAVLGSLCLPVCLANDCEAGSWASGELGRN